MRNITTFSPLQIVKRSGSENDSAWHSAPRRIDPPRCYGCEDYASRFAVDVDVAWSIGAHPFGACPTGATQASGGRKPTDTERLIDRMPNLPSPVGMKPTARLRIILGGRAIC